MTGYVVDYPEQAQPNVNVYAQGGQAAGPAQGSDKAGPAGKWRKGNVTVTKWTNVKNINGRQIPIDSFVLEKIYKDQQGNWQSTKTFDKASLIKLYFLLGEVLKEVL